ncbi:MAG: SDR family oxidoreductase [Bacteroidales bacterium]|nr:SDR family oxidoreductase [Bacteroidales bacterium]
MNIIVTGASRGIGRALVLKLAENSDYRIVAISRDAKKLDELQAAAKEINPDSNVIPAAFDLSSEGYAFNLLPKILKHFNAVDVLVNNAGKLIKKDFESLTDADFDEVFNVNVKSVFRLSRALLPNFNPGSHIVNVSSMGGVQGSSKFPGLSLYSAAKGAVSVLTEAMAEELKDRGIRVNCLAYGAVQTEMLAEAFPGYEAPLKANDMAEYAAWFVIHGHKFFNGKILQVSISTP